MALPLLLGGAAKGLLGSGKKKPKSGKEVAGKIVKRTKKSDKKTESKSKAPQQKLISSTSTFKGSSTTPKIKKLKPTGESSLDSVLQGIQSTLSKLSSTIGNFVKFKRKESKEKTKRNNKVLARLRESGFAILGGALSLGKKLLDKVPFFDRIKDFFVNILLGGIVLMILDNIKSIIETIKKVVKEVKKVFKLLNEYLFEPLMKAGKFLIDTITPIINDIIKLIPAESIKTGIENFIKTLEDTFPGFKEITNNIKNAINELKNTKLPGGNTVGETVGSSQYDTSSGGLLAPGGVEQGAKAKEQVSQAGFGESEFILYRDAVAKIESGGEYDTQGGSGDMYSGRYQMGAAARENAARFLGEEYQGDSEAARKTFREDKQMQERYFAAYTRANHETLMQNPTYAAMSNEQQLQVLGYAHNAGAGNALDWLKNNMQGSVRDGFDTKSSDFADAIKKAQQKRRQSVSPALRSQSSSSSGGAFDTGLKTGPSQFIGGSSSFHIDTKISSSLSMDEKIAMMDQLAKSYESQGRVIEFSNRQVANRVYTSDMSMDEKRDLLQSAFAAHNLPRGRAIDQGGFNSIDYYVPLRSDSEATGGKGRFRSSAEGVEILVPTTKGGSLEYHSGGSYGNFVVVLDSKGNVVSKTGHGDTRYGRSSGTVRFGNEQPQVTAPTERKTAEEISKQTDYERMRTIFMPIASPNNGGGDSSSGGGPPSIIGGSSRDTYLQIMTETKLFRQ